MKYYELTIIYNPELDIEQSMKEVEDLIISFGGKIADFEDDGLKTLAYPILNHGKGYYAYYVIASEEPIQTKLSTALNIKDCLLRYLLVQGDTRKKYHYLNKEDK